MQNTKETIDITPYFRATYIPPNLTEINIDHILSGPDNTAESNNGFWIS